MAQRGVNKVILIGNLGGDPDAKYTPRGILAVQISVATSEVWKDEAGQQQERTEWHRVIFWRKLGEIAKEYLHRGSKVYIEGVLRTRKYQHSGQDRYVTEIIGHTLQMLDRAEGHAPTTHSAAPVPGAAADTDTGYDDEIPF